MKKLQCIRTGMHHHTILPCVNHFILQTPQQDCQKSVQIPLNFNYIEYSALKHI